MKILTFTTLYPNAARPVQGIFVETRLRQLLSDGRLDSKVVAPVPWFPFRNNWFGEYAIHAQAPHEEFRHGIEVLHPRYPLIPKIGMSVAPFLLAQAVAPTIERLHKRYAFDLIDAHYFYPDGVAAAILGRRFRKPVVITARGTDVTLIPRFRLPRKMIRWAAGQAAGLVTVSRSLKDGLVQLGIAPERIAVLRNGVDLGLFRPLDRDALRAALNIEGKMLLSVGHLIPRKAHDMVIRALPFLQGVGLIVIGTGPERAALGSLAADLRVAARVRFVDAMGQEELAKYYAAADALVLASSREGWANVLLEAMACGTPVVASDVGGSSEVVASPEAGLLMPERTPEALARTVQSLFSTKPDRAATRRYAERFSWTATTNGQIDLLEEILAPQAAAKKCSIQVPEFGG